MHADAHPCGGEKSDFLGLCHVIVVVVVIVTFGVVDGMMVVGGGATVLAAGIVVPGLVAIIRFLVPRVWHSKQVEDTIKRATRQAKVVWMDTVSQETIFPQSWNESVHEIEGDAPVLKQ